MTRAYIVAIILAAFTVLGVIDLAAGHTRLGLASILLGVVNALLLTP